MQDPGQGVRVTPTEAEAPAPNEAVAVYKKAAAHRLRLEQEVEQAKIELARESFPHFVEYVIKDSHTGEFVKLAQIHQSWCDHITKFLPTEFDIGVLAPWGHGKSVEFAIALPLWLIGRNPNVRIGVICNADGNASKRVSSVGDYIKKSEAYHKVFPDVRPATNKSWNEHRLIVERSVIAPEGTLEAYGIDSSGVGSRFDVMIYDDPIDQKDGESEAIRKNRIIKFNNVWSSRIEPHGKSFYIATRWHKYDNTHEVLQRDNWRFIVQAVAEDFSGIIEPPNDYLHYPTVVNKDSPRLLPFWLSKWPEKQVRNAAKRFGLRAFNRGFRQKPFSDEDSLFSEEHVLAACKWNVTVEEAAPPEWPRYLGADLSSDRRPGTVVVVVARDKKTGRKVVVEVARGSWGWSSRTASKIYEMFMRHNCRVGYVENNAAQEIMLTLIKSLFGRDVALKGFTTGRQKADPIDGLPGMAVEFENEAWLIPLAHIKRERQQLASSQEPEVVLIRELLEYPHGDFSDCPMALWFASEAAKSGNQFIAPGVYRGHSDRRVFSEPAPGSSHRVFGLGYKSGRLFEVGGSQ